MSCLRKNFIQLRNLEYPSGIFKIYESVFSIIFLIYLVRVFYIKELVFFRLDYGFLLTPFEKLSFEVKLLVSSLLLLTVGCVFLLNLVKKIPSSLYLLSILIFISLLNAKPFYSVEDLLLQYSLLFILFTYLPENLSDLLSFRYQIDCSARPFLLIMLNTAFLFMSAGFTKHLDPIWLEGLGIYYTHQMSWTNVLPQVMLPLFVYETLNYVTIILEVAILPLFLFKKTRTLSILLLVSFFAILTFPIRLDFIGQFGLALFICFYFINAFEKSSFKVHRSFTFKSMLLGSLVLLSSFCFFMNNFNLLTKYKYPRTYSPIVVLGEDQYNYFETTHLQLWLNNFNKYLFRNSQYTLFNIHHLFGLYGFQIKNENGEKLLNVFEDNLMGGEETLYPFMTRYPQVLMYHFSNVAEEILANRRVPKYYDRLFVSLHAFLRSKGKLSEGEWAYLSLAKINMPLNFELSYKRKVNFKKVLKFGKENWSLIDLPEKYDETLYQDQNGNKFIRYSR